VCVIRAGVLVKRASWISMCRSELLLWRIPSAVSTLPPPYAEPMDKVVKSCATFLARWRGATAKTSELAWPRGALRIVLTADGRLGNLVLTCLDPVWIRGPRDWSDTDLTVTPALAADGFQVADRAAGVELVAGWIPVAEHMKLKPPTPPRPAPQPQPKGTEPVFRTGQPVRVVLNEYNRTARRGTVEHSFWHYKHHCWYFHIRDDRGRRVSKQYATEDLQPDEPS
jgi:hypothetical protein